MYKKSRFRKSLQLMHVTSFFLIAILLFLSSCSQKIGVTDQASNSEKATKIEEQIDTDKNSIGEDERTVHKLEVVYEESDESEINLLKESKKEESLSYEATNEHNNNLLDFDRIYAVPFSDVEKVPTLSECENLSKWEAKTCMNNTLRNFFLQNFDSSIAENLGLKGRQNIRIGFKIGEQGDIVGIRITAPHPKIEAEAERVILSLPKMNAGENDSQKVAVLYTLPIILDL